jgi:hypothetical protein
MDMTTQMAKHLRDVHFGGNWTVSNLRDNLQGITWQQATTKIYTLNTIATLVYHMNYFVSAALGVLRGEPLTAKDEYSFSHPPIESQEDWQQLVDKALADAESFATLIEKLPENMLWEDFTDKKYGTYYRNIHGIIEHTHYHLGQIALIKKILPETKNN